MQVVSDNVFSSAISARESVATFQADVDKDVSWREGTQAIVEIKAVKRRATPPHGKPVRPRRIPRRTRSGRTMALGMQTVRR